MTNQQIIRTLKIVMVIGVSFIAIGLYCHLYSDYIDSLGVTGLIISGGFVAVGMAMSLPTKMFLTFVWVQHEIDEDKQHPHQKN